MKAYQAECFVEPAENGFKAVLVLRDEERENQTQGLGATIFEALFNAFRQQEGPMDVGILEPVDVETGQSCVVVKWDDPGIKKTQGHGELEIVAVMAAILTMVNRVAQRRAEMASCGI
jgi:hypothetical protein